MPQLVAIALTGQRFVDAMRRVWEDGDAALPIDPRLPKSGADALLEAMRPTRIIDSSGESSELPNSLPTEPGDALVVPTSGSTGVPKGVVHTHTAIAASARSTSSALGVDPATDRWLCCLPLSHIAGLAVVARALTLDVPLIVHDRFEAAAVMEAAAQGATLTALVPTALSRIDTTTFRRIIVGGSAAPAFLPDNCVMSYGMTETGSAIVFDGRALPGVELRVLDDEIQVRGEMLLRCYRDGTDPRTSDGWLPTNDAGSLVDGILTVRGRRGDLIITGGENVWPAPIETLLETLDSISEVAVVGRRDDEWGEVVTAVVVPSHPDSPPTLDELREAVRTTMPPYCAPRRLELVAELPRTPLGKVERRSL
jgi:O-succinylbenzoic acid--CoA ligase